MPEFFIPGTDDEASADHVWQATRKFAASNVTRKVTDRRIRRIHYHHDGHTHEAIVGEPDERQGETVICILEADGLYLVCTYNRGVKRGLPILVGEAAAIEVEDFDM